MSPLEKVEVQVCIIHRHFKHLNLPKIGVPLPKAQFIGVPLAQGFSNSFSLAQGFSNKFLRPKALIIVSD